MTRIAIELTLWFITMTVVTSLTGCSTAQQSAQQESGADEQCVLTTEGQDCRTTEGISQK